jgi:hypothetical protein
MLVSLHQGTEKSTLESNASHIGTTPTHQACLRREVTYSSAQQIFSDVPLYKLAGMSQRVRESSAEADLNGTSSMQPFLKLPTSKQLIKSTVGAR